MGLLISIYVSWSQQKFNFISSIIQVYVISLTKQFCSNAQFLFRVHAIQVNLIWIFHWKFITVIGWMKLSWLVLNYYVKFQFFLSFFDHFYSRAFGRMSLAKCVLSWARQNSNVFIMGAHYLLGQRPAYSSFQFHWFNSNFVSKV